MGRRLGGGRHWVVSAVVVVVDEKRRLGSPVNHDLRSRGIRGSSFFGCLHVLRLTNYGRL